MTRDSNQTRRSFSKTIGAAAAALGTPVVLSTTASAFSNGERVEVTPDIGLKTYEQPGSNYITAMPQDTVGEIVNGPTNKNGYTWWGIHWLEDDIWGWSVEKYLASASSDGGSGGGSSGGGSGGSGLPSGTWWGVENGKSQLTYNEYKAGYEFGCNGDQRHKGVDVGAPTGNKIYAWGPGRVVGRGYDSGGYNRWIQVYFPSTDQSLTLGHLLNGSEMTVGTTFDTGDVWAEMGTDSDGLGASHVHYRASSGNHGASPIGPCEDMNPFIVWDDLGLPS